MVAMGWGGLVFLLAVVLLLLVLRRPRAVDRSALFAHGTRIGEHVVRVVRAGEVALPTGRICICDPFLEEAQPLSRAVAPGTYPVDVSTMFAGNALVGVALRVAAMRIVLRDTPVVAWEPARVSSPNMLVGDRCAVDSGVVACMDASTRSLAVDLQRPSIEQPWGERRPTPDHALVLAFSGFGDGFYASYWGLDVDGNVACLLTDFAIA